MTIMLQSYIFFLKTLASPKKICIFALIKPAPKGVACQITDESETSKAVCRAGRRKRGVYVTLPFCKFKLRTIESSHRGNATISACVGWLYPNCQAKAARQWNI